VGDQCNQGVGTEFGGARRFIDAGGTVPGNSFNYLVGAGEQRRRHVEAERMQRGETRGIREGWRSN
jgi:hypothetical protein